MKPVLIVLCSLVSVATYAKVAEDTTKTTSPCPIQIESFGRVVQTQQEGLGNFQAKYKNQSNKTIIGVKFGIEVMDWRR